MKAVDAGCAPSTFPVGEWCSYSPGPTDGLGAAKRFDVVPNDADRRILVLAGPLYDPGPGTGFSLETKRGEAEAKAARDAHALTS